MRWSLVPFILDLEFLGGSLHYLTWFPCSFTFGLPDVNAFCNIGIFFHLIRMEFPNGLFNPDSFGGWLTIVPEQVSHETVLLGKMRCLTFLGTLGKAPSPRRPWRLYGTITTSWSRGWPFFLKGVHSSFQPRLVVMNSYHTHFIMQILRQVLEHLS